MTDKQKNLITRAMTGVLFVCVMVAGLNRVCTFACMSAK